MPKVAGMEREHKFDMSDGQRSDGERLAIIVNGTIAGTAYHIEMSAKYECGDSWVCCNRTEVAKDLRRELEPLRPELTDADYLEAAGELVAEAAEFASDYFTETNHRRYFPA